MSITKHSSALSEAAFIIANHGFEVDSFGSLDHGWNDLVDVSEETLVALNTEPELVSKLKDKYSDLQDNVVLRVWVRENAQGFVEAIEWAPSHRAEKLEEHWEWARHEFEENWDS